MSNPCRTWTERCRNWMKGIVPKLMKLLADPPQRRCHEVRLFEHGVPLHHVSYGNSHDWVVCPSSRQTHKLQYPTSRKFRSLPMAFCFSKTWHRQVGNLHIAWVAVLGPCPGDQSCHPWTLRVSEPNAVYPMTRKIKTGISTIPMVQSRSEVAMGKSAFKVGKSSCWYILII